MDITFFSKTRTKIKLFDDIEEIKNLTLSILDKFETFAKAMLNRTNDKNYEVVRSKDLEVWDSVIHGTRDYCIGYANAARIYSPYIVRVACGDIFIWPGKYLFEEVKWSVTKD